MQSFSARGLNLYLRNLILCHLLQFFSEQEIGLELRVSLKYSNSHSNIKSISWTGIQKSEIENVNNNSWAIFSLFFSGYHHFHCAFLGRLRVEY
jgi:hypothetical protein